MKKFHLFVAGLCLLGLAVPCSVFAGKGGGGKRGTKPPDVFSQYDKNGNGVLDADEKDAIRKDFEKDSTGLLKAYDTNSDGKLSDDEIAAIKPSARKHRKEKKNR